MGSLGKWRLLSLIFIVAFLPSPSIAQTGTCPFNGFDGDDLLGTAWQYQATRHEPSGKIIHQAIAIQPSWIYFKYDHSYEALTNEKMSSGEWSWKEGVLSFLYRGEEQFCAEIRGSEFLTLTYTRKGTRQQFSYIFRRVSLSHTPFNRPFFELPTIIVEQDSSHSAPFMGRKKTKRRWWTFWRKDHEAAQTLPPPVYISIEVSGGGYYGGLNPVQRQFLRINTDGRLIREVQTVREGLMVTRKNIKRQELEALAEWIASAGYFELAREYDCQDTACRRRKLEKPKPIPLQLMVAFGEKKHVITIAIFGPDDKMPFYHPYPKLIDQIVMTVYKMADRLD